MNNILLTGGPGTGKTVFARAMAFYICEKGLAPDDVFDRDIRADHEDIERFAQSDRVEFIQVHASMTYEDIVYGMQPDTAVGFNLRYAAKRVMELCGRACGSAERYCIILDDMGRTDAGALLGNLLYGMEYRNQPIEMADGARMIVPDNVWFILTECSRLYGTGLDYALRRRMDHVRQLVSSREVLEQYYGGAGAAVAPGAEMPPAAAVSNGILDVYDRVRTFVESGLSGDPTVETENFVPGHGMFLVDIAGSPGEILLRFQRKFEYQIAPYLRELQRSGILDGDLEIFLSEILGQLNGGIRAEENRIVRIEKIFYKTGRAVTPFTLADSLDYLQNTILPDRCKEHRGIMECVLDAMILNGLLPYDILMAELFLNTNIVRFAHRTRPGRYAAFLCEDTEHNDFGYLTSVSNHSRSYYSSNSVRTGRWVSEKDAPAYKVTDRDGVARIYLYLNAFRNVGFDVGSNVIHAQENTASIYAAVYRLIHGYLRIYEDHMSLMAGLSADHADSLRLARAERETFEDLNQAAQRLGGAENKLCHLCGGIPDLKLLWNQKDAVIPTETGGTMVIKGVERMTDLKDYQKIMEDIGVRQMVFQGPPGTSKTFESKRFVLAQLEPGAAALAKAMPTQEEISAALESYKLTAEDYEDPAASPKLGTGGWDLVQFHPSYGYEDFIRGIEVKPVGGAPTYSSVNRILGKLAEFAEIAEKASAGPAPRFYLIIDEINRANLATVFGELIYGLEYRDSRVSTPYYVESKVTGAQTKDIVLGKNLFLIGTMNTADKSIDAIDYAIRRRFLFIDSPADRKVVLNCYQNTSGKSDEDSIELLLFDAVGALFDNEDYFNREYRKSDVRLGHTYFLRTDPANYADAMAERFIFQVIPILREYEKDGILESVEDLRGREHDVAGITAETDPAARVRMVSDNIMLYIQHFGDDNGAGKVMDNAYIAGFLSDLGAGLGY
ncbi:MAG: AAA family ATPase [Clostridium sp.]|nr:AAA family ATPase [Acetatifactor muris]MCM1526966.1 AAA family ATPase [Bacteroides sp.]MCM1563129.1 AAA family ATPase [Clostridium sp.]